MLTLHLAPIFKARGIERPFTFLVNAGMTRHSATRLLNNKLGILRLDHLELLCRVLVCEPNDLFLFTPEKDQQYTSDHPLLKLKKKGSAANLYETIATMPYAQLKEITKNILVTTNNSEAAQNGAMV